jgi:hypothetical protein
MLKIDSFAEIEPEFIERTHAVVWCNSATVDTHGRTRVLHPIWENNQLIANRRTSVASLNMTVRQLRNSRDHYHVRTPAIAGMRRLSIAKPCERASNHGQRC